MGDILVLKLSYVSQQGFSRNGKEIGVDNMIRIQPGRHAFNILSVLSIVDEFPISASELFGPKRVIRDVLFKLRDEATEIYRVVSYDGTVQCIPSKKLIWKHGQGNLKSIRLTPQGTEIVKYFHPNYSEYYDRYYSTKSTLGGKRSDTVYLDRAHRIGETVAMFYMAGAECRPYVLPSLQTGSIRQTVPPYPSYYISRTVKLAGGAESIDKTGFTRYTGLLFTSDAAYAVYNTRTAVMKWRGQSELKSKYDLTRIVRMNHPSISGQETDSAFLFGKPGMALKTLEANCMNRRLEHRFDEIYHHIHFIPLSQFGIQLLKLYLRPNWREKILSKLFHSDERSYDQGVFEYDAYIDGRYIFSFLDSDIARLLRLDSALQSFTQRNTQVEIVCFPEQRQTLMEFFDLANSASGQLIIRTIELDLLRNALDAT